MGNCIAVEKKEVIKIMRMDGQILQYQSPLKVQQVLNEFPGHAVSDALPVITYLDPTASMRHGQLYYLLPPEKQITEADGAVGVVRIKLVVTKQQLKDMLSKGGIAPMTCYLFSEENRAVNMVHQVTRRGLQSGGLLYKAYQKAVISARHRE